MLGKMSSLTHLVQTFRDNKVDNLNYAITELIQGQTRRLTVALGYSKLCEKLIEEEWKGFDYAVDRYFWYGSAFGSPVVRGLGIGYVQEVLAHLTHTRRAQRDARTSCPRWTTPRLATPTRPRTSRPLPPTSSCSPAPQICIFINDGIVRLAALHGCPATADSAFVAALHALVACTDWAWAC
ncbi:hypothetical protein C2E23DRAFT_906519 [Lenzites betulinus]|nr:hypothetical protein C2E23DRAFT_906519 [Lenzites betulinus]